MIDSGSPAELINLLRKGIKALGFAPEDHPVEAYLAYIELLARWNKAYNLTAIDQPLKSTSYHLLDSLSVLPYIRGNRCLDIGSGAGLPGLILALAQPDDNWVLLDSNRKKIRFINQVIIELNINNIEPVHCRIEEYNPGIRFTSVTARAWGKLIDLYRVTEPLLHPEGGILAMKGPNLQHELAELDKYHVKFLVHKLDVPGVQGDRLLVEISALPSCK